jgi:hypothetical protein
MFVRETIKVSAAPLMKVAIVTPVFDQWPDFGRSIGILHLGLNLVHQRAIAVGLVDIACREDPDGVFVADCDRGDRPADLALHAPSRYGKADAAASPSRE